MVKLGYQYKDKITGFGGIATGHAQYISGCSQVLLAPPCAADGTMRESQWFDEQRLEAQSSTAVVALDNGATPGPDRQAPKR
jgi:hypothetical protein